MELRTCLVKCLEESRNRFFVTPMGCLKLSWRQPKTNLKKIKIKTYMHNDSRFWYISCSMGRVSNSRFFLEMSSRESTRCTSTNKHFLSSMHVSIMFDLYCQNRFQKASSSTCFWTLPWNCDPKAAPNLQLKILCGITVSLKAVTSHGFLENTSPWESQDP